MDGVFWSSEYYDPLSPGKSQSLPATNLLYNATREGAHLIDEQEKQYMESREALQYIGKRRGVEHVGDEADGLFNAYGKADLQYEIDQITASKAIQWRCVLSLTKEDAEQHSYTTVDSFRQLLNRHMGDVAKAYHITPQNLVWNAAYHPVDKHGRDHHPHIHVTFYSTDPSEGRMNPTQTLKAFEKCRSIFTNDVFREELRAVNERRTQVRDALKKAIEEYRMGSDAAAASGLDADLQALARELPTTGRKVSYQYFPPELKERIDTIVRKMVGLPGIDQAFTDYREACREQILAYNNDEEKFDARMERWDKHFFSPAGKGKDTRFHNAVIRLARELEADGRKIGIGDVVRSGDEVRDFVGVSAMTALRHGDRTWLHSLYETYGDALPSLLKSAQRENWREIYRAVDQSLRVYPDLRDALISECRVYLTSEEQTEGFMSGHNNRWFSPGVTEKTEDMVSAEVQRILFSYSYADNNTAEYVRRTFYEAALDRRVQQWYRNHPKTVERLREITGAVQYRVDSKHAPCPKGVYDAAFSAMSDLMIELGNEDPAFRRERDHLMLRAFNDGDFAGIDRMLNGTLEASYRRELTAAYADVMRSRQDHAELFDAVKQAAGSDGKLPKELRDRVVAMIEKEVKRPIDRKGIYSLTFRLSHALFDERRIEEICERYPKQYAALREAVGLQSDTEVVRVPPVSDALRSMISENDADRDRLDRALLHTAYRDNYSEATDRFYAQLHEKRTTIDELAGELRCGTEITALTDDQRQRLAALLPAEPMDKATTERFEERALQVIEEQRIRQLLKVPDALYERAGKTVQLRQDATALLKDPAVVDSLQLLKTAAREDTELAQVSEEKLDRVLIREVCSRQRQAFVGSLFEQDARATLRAAAERVRIGTPFAEMPPEVQARLAPLMEKPADDRGRELMEREILRRVYNDRFFMLSRDLDTRSVIRAYAHDPHVQSLIRRGVSFDELTRADREVLAGYRNQIRHEEIRAYAEKCPAELDRAIYHAAKWQTSTEQHIQKGALGMIGGLIAAASITRRIMMQQQAAEQQKATQERQQGRGKKKLRRKMTRPQQQPSPTPTPPIEPGD